MDSYNFDYSANPSREEFLGLQHRLSLLEGFAQDLGPRVGHAEAQLSQVLCKFQDDTVFGRHSSTKVEPPRSPAEPVYANVTPGNA